MDCLGVGLALGFVAEVSPKNIEVIGVRSQLLGNLGEGVEVVPVHDFAAQLPDEFVFLIRVELVLSIPLEFFQNGFPLLGNGRHHFLDPLDRLGDGSHAEGLADLRRRLALLGESALEVADLSMESSFAHRVRGPCWYCWDLRAGTYRPRMSFFAGGLGWGNGFWVASESAAPM